MRFTITEGRPYWFDLSTVLLEFQDLAGVANSTLMAAGSDWINNTAEDDQIQTFSKAIVNTVRICLFSNRDLYHREHTADEMIVLSYEGNNNCYYN